MKKNDWKDEIAVPTCEVCEVHGEVLTTALAALPDGETVGVMCELFKCLGEPTRMRILLLLLHGEACVCDLSRALGMTVSAISHQLRVLRTAHLVGFRREGKSVFYFLADAHVRAMIAAGAEHAAD